MPRAFSSGRRSVSTPVSALTSVVLPWSIWPAVATIMRVSPARARAAPSCALNPASSSRQRRSSMNAPSLIRPITGTRQRAKGRRQRVGGTAFAFGARRNRNAGAGQSIDRQRAAADLARARDDRRVGMIRDRCGERRQHALRLRLDVRLRPRQQPQRRQLAATSRSGSAYRRSTASSAASVTLSTAQRALHRVLCDFARSGPCGRR